MSHMDSAVPPLPAGLVVTALSGDGHVAAVADPARRVWAVQYHPEVHHSEYGARVLLNWARLAGAQPNWQPERMLATCEQTVRETLATAPEGSRIVLALSGGVDR